MDNSPHPEEPTRTQGNGDECMTPNAFGDGEKWEDSASPENFALPRQPVSESGASTSDGNANVSGNDYDEATLRSAGGPAPRSKIVSQFFKPDKGRKGKRRHVAATASAHARHGAAAETSDDNHDGSNFSDAYPHGDTAGVQVQAQAQAQANGNMANANTNANDPVLQNTIAERLSELDRQIDKFKAENQRVEQLRAQKEAEAEEFRQQMAETRREQDDKEEEFNNFRRAQMQKLKREKNLFDTHHSEARTETSRKEREQISELHAALADVQQQLEKQKQRARLAEGRFRDQIETVSRRNKDLEDEVHALEKMRLETTLSEIDRGPLKRISSREQDPMGGSNGGNANSGGGGTGSGSAAYAQRGAPGSPHRPVGTPHASQPHHVSFAPTPRGTEKVWAEGVAEPRSPLTDPATGDSGSNSRVHNWAETSFDSLHNAEAGASPNSSFVHAQNARQQNDLNFLTSTDSPIASALADLYHATAQPSQPEQPRVQASKINRHSQYVGDSAAHTNEVPRQGPTPSMAQFAPGQPGTAAADSADDGKQIDFPNGTRKEFCADGRVVVHFFNGDIKQSFANGQIIYFYSESKTTHTTYPDGLEVLEFVNGQTEKNYPDGTQEIGFPDKTAKFIYANGEEETVFPDGTVQRVTANGERAIDFPNGQQEVHTENYKKRRYPDGTVKIVYPDGRQETKYANGRVRVKDKDGYVIVDTTVPVENQLGDLV